MHVGDRIWKTSDPELDKQLRQSFASDNPQFQRQIDLEIYGEVGQPLIAIARNHVGSEHVLKADVGCRNTVFNGTAQTGAEYVQRLIELGLRQFRIELVNETPEQVSKTIHRYRQLLQGEITGSQLWRELKLQNQLGVTRGPMGVSALRS